MSEERARCVVIGIGNPDRGDDGAGRAVARWLRGRLAPEVEIIEQDGEASSLLACFEDAEMAYLVDASSANGKAGCIRRFDVSAAPLPQDVHGLSTHGLGLAEAIELARALGSLPPGCIVYAIEGEVFEPGAPLSAAVKAAVPEVGEGLCRELLAPPGPCGAVKIA